MELKLAQGESIVKSWDYSIAGGVGRQKRKRKDNLTITNKRIIHSAYSDLDLSCEEVYVKDAKAINASYARNGSFLAILKIVFGIIFTICIIGIILKAFSIRWIKDGIDDLRACSLTLDVKTAGSEGSTLSLLAAGALIKRLTVGKFKVKVNKEMAKEIVSEIGAIVLDAKEA